MLITLAEKNEHLAISTSFTSENNLSLGYAPALGTHDSLST